MGLHQDKGDSPESIARGEPVVSISLGDTGRFLFGGRRRRDPVDVVMLESGDGFVFGSDARLSYHGVTRILLGTGPGAWPRRAAESHVSEVLRQRICYAPPRSVNVIRVEEGSF